MTESAPEVAQEVATDAQTVVSDSRAARKEAQTLVSNVASLIHGKSGLLQEEKHKLVSEARAEAEKLVEALKRAEEAIAAKL